jgi:hypothetical protein
MECIENVEFFDSQNGFYCELKFVQSSGIFSRQSAPTDCFLGTVINKKDNNKVLHRVEGSWLEYISFDGVKYWDINYILPASIVRTDAPLPSDSRHREDLLELLHGNLEKA